MPASTFKHIEILISEYLYCQVSWPTEAPVGLCGGGVRPGQFENSHGGGVPCRREFNRLASPKPPVGSEKQARSGLYPYISFQQSELVALMVQNGTLKPAPSGPPARLRGHVSG